MKVIPILRYKQVTKLMNAIIIHCYSCDEPHITSIHFYKNGKYHREDGVARINLYINEKLWYYKGEYYGVTNDFTNKTWKKKVKQLKREEKFKIFI